MIMIWISGSLTIWISGSLAIRISGIGSLASRLFESLWWIHNYLVWMVKNFSGDLGISVSLAIWISGVWLMALWISGSLAHGSMDLWLSGSLALWISGSLALWLMALWIS